MNQQVVSVIIRTKDRPFHLLRALSSIARQSYRELDVVIVNDGGCEVDLSKIKSVSGGLPVNYIRHNICKGRAEAANTGINNARGEYIIFLDDDDYLYSHCIEKLLAGINSKDCNMCYGKSDCYEYKNGEKRFLFNLGRPMDIRVLFYKNFIPINTVLFKKEVVEMVGLFDKDFEIFEDWDFIFRVALAGRVCFIDEIVSEYSIFKTATITYKKGYDYHKKFWDQFYKKHAYFFNTEVLDVCVRERYSEKIEESEKENAKLRQELESIYNSRAWKVISLYRKLKNKCGF